MYNEGDLLRVIRGIRGRLVVGAFHHVAGPQPRNGEYVRVALDEGGEQLVFLANRFELVAQAVPEAEPPAVVNPEVQNDPAEPVDPIRVGDMVKVVRKFDIMGWVPRMDEYVNDGIIRSVTEVIHDDGDEWMHLDGTNWAFPSAALEKAVIMPVAPVAPVKQGPIPDDDHNYPIRAIFVGRGDAAYLGGYQEGDIVNLVREYPGVRAAVYADKPRDGGDGNGHRAVYRNNFHYAPPEVPKEIAVGDMVCCIDAKNLQFLHEGGQYLVYAVTDTQLQIHNGNRKAWYTKARFQLAGAAKPEEKEPDNPVIEFKDAEVGSYAKIVNFVGIASHHNDRVMDGKFYRITDVDHEEGTVTLGDFYETFSAKSLEFYALKGKNGPKGEAPKLPDSLREEFKIRMGGIYHGRLVAYAAVTNGRKEIRVSDICYRTLGHMSNLTEIIISIVPMIEQVKGEGDKALENFQKYFEYIVKESPWAGCFITKDWDEAKEYGLTMDVSKPLSQVVSAAVALRQGHEYYRYMGTFLHMRNLGYSGDVAFLVSMVLSISNGKWQRTEMGNNHQVLQSVADKACTLDFFANSFADHGDVPCTENQHDYKLFRAIDPKAEAYGYRAKDSYEDYAKALVPSEYVGEGWAKKEVIQNEHVLAFADTLTKELKERKK